MVDDAKLRAGIGASAGDDLGDLLEVAVALVGSVSTADDLPEAIEDEAVVRTAGWLWARRPSGVQAIGVMEADVEGAQIRWSGATTSALRQSGALALLLPWTVKSVGIVA